MITEFKALSAELQSRGRPTAYRDVISAVVATLGALGILSGYANWWVHGVVDPVKTEVTRVEKQFDAGEYAVMKYRLSQLEQRAAK